MCSVQEVSGHAFKAVTTEEEEVTSGPGWIEAAQNYEKAVAAHVRQKSSLSLLPHPNFQWFAEFLQGRQEIVAEGTVSTIKQDRHVFAVIHDYESSCRHGSRMTELPGEEALDRLVSHPRPRNGSGQLIFLRGFPTSNWLKVVGSQYGINPEFFRRHMEFKIPTEKFFDLPGLPSSNDNLLKLSIITVGLHTRTASRKESGADDLRRHWEDVKSRNRVGESIVRRFNWHFARYFSIEQHLSICVVPQFAAGWTCIVLSDSGRELSVGPEGPWFRLQDGVQRDLFLPIVIPSSADLNAKPKFPLSRHITSAFNCTQTVSELHSRFVRHKLDPRVLAVSPFYALHNVYRMAAASESQFLNMLHVLLDDEYTRFNDPHRMQESFDNLKYQKEILNDHVQQLETTLLTINKRGSKNWPAATDPELLAIAEDAALLLHEDFSNLLERAKRLARECAEGVEDVRNAASLEEAKKGINQARVVGRLTMLASIFVPLSFTTSFFGMNVRELGSDVSIWIWLAISLPLFLAAVAFCLCNKLNLLRLRRRCAQRDLAEEGLVLTD